MWKHWGDIWALGDHIHIDGPARRFIIHPEVNSISTIEIYSAWVRWVSLYDHLKYLPALRTVGNDILPENQVTGLFIFLMNGWQILIDHTVTLEGIIYHDDPINPFLITNSGGITNKVAALAYGVTTSSGTTGPTAEQIAEAVWAKQISTFTDKTTVGGFLTKLVLTVPKFLGLK